MARTGKKLKRHIGVNPVGFTYWRGHSSKQSKILGGKSRNGKEKECRLFKQFARVSLASWREDPSWTALPGDIITFKGCLDAKRRLVWGIENFKKFHKHGKIMVGNNHGVYMSDNENNMGYALTYALICRLTWNEKIDNIKFNAVNW